ncbi:adenosylcobyric acid synthase [Motilibacter peucedani]|uniref:Cobyric acid synthase n=1 Tax=Motilibacter peucedani TaxID=598650 RepID=A0A420XNL6_9ACTN|nr:cobyric acid synthase [Motilibacter peucedani]RKS73775.1 adenosylcobyric acid synthase [Motilibacter peucedani]
MSGALLVAGTTSDAGKSLLTAGICRWLVRRGLSVAPFKAQNMSLNSWVTADGAEIGRAQAVQAAAARVEPEAAMNPVLLKPGSDRHSQVVLLGRPVAEVDAMSYREHKPRLLEVALESLADLRRRFDVVVCEGAGSPAEINLRDRDIANMGLARAAGLPVVVVGDIDRGGVFASMFGTLSLLSAADQALVAGFVVNKFRGDPALLEPGLAMLRVLTGRPVLGVVPWVGGLQLDLEDSLGMDVPRAPAGPPVGAETLRVAVVRLPRVSNATDVDALACEPGVEVVFADRPEQVLAADLAVLPGSRATVTDLDWLRSRGLDVALALRADRGLPVLGICGGYQMLGCTIVDPVESRRGEVEGLGLLPASTRFERDKTLGRPRGTAAGGEPVEAYEIHHGIVTADAEPLFTTSDGVGEGCRAGSVWGTTWHGVLENDLWRRAFLREVADLAGRAFEPAQRTSFAAVRDARLDALGDLVENHCDTGALLRLIEEGAPTGLPFVPPGAPEVPA